eukprot:gene50174-68175_t
MADEEVQKIISNGEREVGFTFDPKASELTVSIARGSPYVASLLCHHASQSALLDSRIVVATADVTFAVEQVHAEFQVRIGKALVNRVSMLVDQGHGEHLDIAARAVISAEGPIGVKDIQKNSDLDAKAAERMISALMDAGILSLADDDAS